jgi:transcriptional regulator with XRE-family HTH domain
MHIGERIKAQRIKLGWSQRDLAERIGYKNHSVVARIEAGKVDLPQSRLDQFAQVLGVSHAYLLGLVTEDQSKKNDQLAQLIVRMRKDPEFFEAVSNMADLSASEFENVRGLLSALGKK